MCGRLCAGGLCLVLPQRNWGCVLQRDFSDIICKHPWLLHFTRYYQSVQQAPYISPYLQTSRKGLCSAVNFNCSFEIGENWERLRKLSHISTLFVMFLKGSESHGSFDCQVTNTLLRRAGSRGNRVGRNQYRCSLCSACQNSPPKPGGASVNEMMQ